MLAPKPWSCNRNLKIMNYYHEPVMLKEIVEYLQPKNGGYFIDCTLGGGGYTLALAKKVGKRGKVIAIDLDEDAIQNMELKIKDLKLNNIELVHGNFKDLSKIVHNILKKERNKKFNGLVFDLGLSLHQLQDGSRGFSFLLDAPLNMNFSRQDERGDVSESKTVKIVNYYSERELEKIIREYGEEKFSRQIARKIIQHRQNKKIETTKELADIVSEGVPNRFKKGKTNPATKTFQALRIATNNELESLKEVLPQAVDLLEKGARLAVVSFHSLEDRIVKRFFKEESRDCLCPPNFPICQCDHVATIKILNKKPIIPSTEEIEKNPRSRSAKLRVVEKIR